MKLKYVVVDTHLELTFVTGDLKVASQLIGRSHRTMQRWFDKADYYNLGRFIISKSHVIKRRYRGVAPENFLKHKFTKT